MRAALGVRWEGKSPGKRTAWTDLFSKRAKSGIFCDCSMRSAVPVWFFSGCDKRKGAVAQLVRVPDCRSGGWGFESPRPRLVKALIPGGLRLLLLGVSKVCDGRLAGRRCWPGSVCFVSTWAGYTCVASFWCKLSCLVASVVFLSPGSSDL